MEKTGTVTIGVEKYNELRDFKTEIEKGNCLYTESSLYGRHKTWVTTDFALDEVVKDNKGLKQECQQLRLLVRELEKNIRLKDAIAKTERKRFWLF